MQATAFVAPTPPASRLTQRNRAQSALSVPRFGTSRVRLQQAARPSPGATRMSADNGGAVGEAAGWPWAETIAGDGSRLLFMKFLTQQKETMEAALPGLRAESVPGEFAYQRATKRPARIASECFSSDHFRKIRLTYIDAGLSAQVFNSVWYPRHALDAPVLGIDFLSFGPKKVLCVMDFQPLTQDAAYLEKYCARMEAVRDKYEGLKGRMSAKFYDEALYFSKQLIFARYGEEGRQRVDDELFPAFVEYVDEYVRMVQGECAPDAGAEKRIAEWQREYDQYSAERDPAVGLFSSYWGKDWAERFTYDFLFSEAVVPEAEMSV